MLTAITNNNKTFEKFPVGILFIEINTHGVRCHRGGRGRCRAWGPSSGGWRVHKWSLAASRTARLGKNSFGGEEAIHLIAEQQHSSRLTPFALLHKTQHVHYFYLKTCIQFWLIQPSLLFLEFLQLGLTNGVDFWRPDVLSVVQSTMLKAVKEMEERIIQQ